MTKWIIGIALVVIVGVGVWWSGALQSLMSPPTAPAPAATTTPQQTQQQQPQATNDLPTQPTDDSDAAIVQDEAAVDTQMQGLTTDSSNVDSSLNDKQGAQEF